MKKLLCFTLFFSILGIVACKKSTPAIQPTTLQKLKSLETKYSRNRKTARTTGQDAAGTILSDACGALGGAAFSPLGAFAGAVCGSCSYVWGFGWLVVPGPTPTSSNPNNPYDNFGSMHNLTCANLMTIDNAQTPLSQVVDHSISQATLNWPAIFNAPVSHADVITLVQLLKTTSQNGGGALDQLNALQNGGYITAQENQIANEYFSLFLTADEPIAYSIDAESIVNSATDMSESSKKKFLISMSIARNSSLLWVAP